MAAGFLDRFAAGPRLRAPAGSEPADKLNRAVAMAMAEKGHDIRAAVPRLPDAESPARPTSPASSPRDHLRRPPQPGSQGRRRGARWPAPDELAAYGAAQVSGGVGGAVVANARYGLSPVALCRHTRGVALSRRTRDGAGVLLAEVVATRGPLLVIAA